MNEEQINQFISLVTQMRKAQKMFFKTKDKKYLIMSIDKENRVDNLIKKYEENKKALSDNKETKGEFLGLLKEGGTMT